MKSILAKIVVSQFFCTSLWFAGNAIMPDIIQQLHFEAGSLAHLTSVVQFGFILGTLVFALFMISDRISPSRVFFISSLIAGGCNLAITLDGIQFASLVTLRFFTGFFLAGIYPIGMKIASDYFQKGLGKSLGFLVGALVLGTAFPHLLKWLTMGLPWKYVLFSTSALSAIGGTIILLFVPDGPYRKAGQQIKLAAFFKVFRNREFRAAALGYFGHMWELYAFWAFVPVILRTYKEHYPGSALNIPFYSFLIIASGGIACAVTGWLSQRWGTKRMAMLLLFLSCICCLLSPLFLFNPSVVALLVFLFFWGLVVIADSPLFSTLVAQNAPGESRGTSLTMVTCIGFAITIVSIELMSVLLDRVNTQFVYMALAIGPVLGLLALLGKRGKAKAGRGES